jgi:chorismate-pyruvate lyase
MSHRDVARRARRPLGRLLSSRSAMTRRPMALQEQSPETFRLALNRYLSKTLNE